MNNPYFPPCPRPPTPTGGVRRARRVGAVLPAAAAAVGGVGAPRPRGPPGGGHDGGRLQRPQGTQGRTQGHGGWGSRHGIAHLRISFP